MFVVTCRIFNGQCVGPSPNLIATGPVGEPLIPGRPWAPALMSTQQSAAPVPCLLKWPPSQGQGRLPTSWVCVLPGWRLCHQLCTLSPQPGQHAGHRTPAAGPAPGAHRLAQRASWYVQARGRGLAQTRSCAALSTKPLIYPAWGNGGGWVEGGVSPTPDSRLSWIPNFKLPSSHGEAKGCGRGVVCTNDLGYCAWVILNV